MANARSTRKALLQQLEPYMYDLFYPSGPLGGTVYYINDQGFYGPHWIPEWIVPLKYTKQALVAFESELEGQKSVQDIDADHLERIAGKTDLYDKGCDLDASTFVDMIRNGCEPDTYYFDVDDSGEYLEMDTFFEDNIRETYSISLWKELQVEDLRFWIELLSEPQKQ